MSKSPGIVQDIQFPSHDILRKWKERWAVKTEFYLYNSGYTKGKCTTFGVHCFKEQVGKRWYSRADNTMCLLSQTVQLGIMTQNAVPSPLPP